MELARRSFPVVNIDDECLNLKMHTVKYNDAAGAGQAVAHLLKVGHRRIVFCSSTMRFQTVQDRFRGYREALMADGLPVDEALCLNASTGLAAWPWPDLAGLLESSDPPTALFAENDAMAMACIRLLHRRGLRVPADVAVVGFGNVYAPHAVEKPLTTVALPLEDACNAAVDMLLSLIEKAPEDRKKPEIKVLEPHLVMGETT